MRKFSSPDPLLSAFDRHKAAVRPSCVTCLAHLRYKGLSADDAHHEFVCLKCGSEVLFDRIAQQFVCNDADRTPIVADIQVVGDVHDGGPLHGSDSPDNDLPPEAA